MRLGEIKNIIKACLNDNDQIHILNEAQYGGQAQLVQNYQEIIAALDVLHDQSWNDLDYAPIEEIKEQHDVTTNPVLLSQEEFNKVNSYVSAVNQKLPVFIGLLETMVEEQDPQIINIKLPEKIKSIEDLQKFNKRLIEIFKRFNLAGEFEFKGLDKGTSWYEILITAPLLYAYFIACLKLASSVLNLKKTYYDGEIARLTYEAMKEKAKEEKSKEEWVEIIMEKQIENGIDTAINEVKERNGKTPEELKTLLVNATKELVKELGEGTEFHLSFNPPEFAKETNGALEIDYKKMPKINPEVEVKKIEASKEESTPEKDKND
jgi:hypothetical protein